MEQVNATSEVHLKHFPSVFNFDLPLAWQEHKSPFRVLKGVSRRAYKPKLARILKVNPVFNVGMPKPICDDRSQGKCFEERNYSTERLVQKRLRHLEIYKANQTSVIPRIQQGYDNGWGNVTGYGSNPVTNVQRASYGGQLFKWGSFDPLELARFMEHVDKPIYLKPRWPIKAL
ncbi:hypothetical protein J1N35_025286 [Gossypium stocksii]|uniref:Uncharacterized protein n=1 Tax=Gossypium stocksii TaxID=47602 RepID=A0A9D3V8R3_9ROSI|nr:hypothetical protein J1N35_025286 [Gossypium stocksii]